MTDVWPGRPFPLGRDLGRRRHELLAVLRARRAASSCACSTTTDDETRIEIDRAHRAQLALLPARRRARAALRLPRPRPLRAARGPPLQPRQAPDRPLREGDRRRRRLGARRQRAARTSRPATRTPTSSPTTRTTPRRCRSAVVIDDAFDWEGDRPPRIAVRTTPSSTRPTSRASRCATPTSARTCAARTPGSPPSRRSRYLHDLGVTAVELLPVHHIADESFLAERGLTQLLGLQHDRLPRAALRVRRHRAPRRAGARVQGDGQGAPPRRHRGDPRRRLQPHRRGQPPRADAVVQGRRQPRLLPARCPTTRATTWTSPAPATRSTRSTRACCG